MDVSDLLLQPHCADLLVQILLGAVPRSRRSPVGRRPGTGTRKMLVFVFVVVGVVVLLRRERGRRREPQVGSTAWGARHHVHTALYKIQQILPIWNILIFKIHITRIQSCVCLILKGRYVWLRVTFQLWGFVGRVVVERIRTWEFE